MNESRIRTIAAYSAALMITTSVHHVYGAEVYNTPWRLHVLFLSIPVLVITWVLYRMLRKDEPPFKPFAYWTFMVITIVASVVPIGIYEGLYNHVLKNVLFFGGASSEVLQRLFPAPLYEMPNNFFFEMTGVAQGFIVLPLIGALIRTMLARVKANHSNERL